MMMMIVKSFCRQWCSVAAAGLLGLAASSAQAVVALPVSASVEPTVLVAPGPGTQAITTLTYDFGADYAFNSIFLKVDYDPAFLTFNRAASSVSVVGMPPAVSLPDAVMLLDAGFGPGVDVDNDNSGAGQYTLSGLTIEPSYPLPAGTKLVLSGVFDVKSALTAGTSTNVFISTTLAGSALDPFQEDTFSDMQITVSAVPEPETWMMLLGGLGLLAARARRAAAARRQAERDATTAG